MTQEQLMHFPNPRASEHIVTHHDLSCEMVTTSYISGKTEDVVEHAAWIVQNDDSDGPGNHFLARVEKAVYSDDKKQLMLIVKKNHLSDSERYPNGWKNPQPWFTKGRNK